METNEEMASNDKIDWKNKFVQRYWNIFPIIENVLPREIKEEVRLFYSPKTNDPIIISSLNNTFFRIIRMKHRRRDEEIGTAFIEKAEINLPMGLVINLCC